MNASEAGPPATTPRMNVRPVNVERFSVMSSQPIEVVLARIAAAVGHPEPKALAEGVQVRDARSYADRSRSTDLPRRVLDAAATVNR